MMGKLMTFLGLFWANLLWADSSKNINNSPSSNAYIAIVVILLIAIVWILYSRQKRKFND